MPPPSTTKPKPTVITPSNPFDPFPTTNTHTHTTKPPAKVSKPLPVLPPKKEVDLLGFDEDTIHNTNHQSVEVETVDDTFDVFGLPPSQLKVKTSNHPQSIFSPAEYRKKPQSSFHTTSHDHDHDDDDDDDHSSNME
jgi:hypothetical protein